MKGSDRRTHRVGSGGSSIARWARIALLSSMALVLTGCGGGGGGYTWGWYVVLPTTDEGKTNFFYLIAGFGYTLQLTALGFLFGVIIGLILAMLGRSHNPALRAFVRGYIAVARSIPTFVLLLWVYYALPVMMQSLPPEVANLPGIWHITNLSPLTAAALTLALSAGAFLSEIFRAGIEGVPRGHVEAALSVGMSRSQAMRRIVLPQALRRMLPPTASQFIQTMKDSALASTIGFRELTRRVSELQNQTYKPLELYTFLAIEYLIIIIFLSYLVRVMERRIAID
jgi:polar amino acid transport system permease protein